MTELDETFGRVDGAFKSSVENSHLYAIYFLEIKFKLWDTMLYGHMNESFYQKLHSGLQKKTLINWFYYNQLVVLYRCLDLIVPLQQTRERVGYC